MPNNEGRFFLEERELRLKIGRATKTAMTMESIKVMINLLPNDYFSDIIKTYQTWLEDNGYDGITEPEFNFIKDVINLQVRKLNEEKLHSNR